MTVYKDTRKSIPQPGTKAFESQMRQALETYMGLQGSPLDRGITVGDLAAAGLIDVSPAFLAGQSRNPIKGINTGGGSGGGGGGIIIVPPEEYEPDLTPPPTPTGFAATGGIAFIIVTCDNQIYTQGHGHAVSNLYGAKWSGTGPKPTFSDAILLTSFSGTVFGYPTEPSTNWCLWLKWRTTDGVESSIPAGGTNGVLAVTGADVRNLLDAISEAAKDPLSPYSRVTFRADFFDVSSVNAPTGAPVFTVVTTPLTIGGVTVPVGTYFQDGYILNGTITNAKIANLAVDDAKIVSLSVSKLVAGSLQVGSYIQSTNYVPSVSGFRINSNGTIDANEGNFRGGGFFGNGLVGGIRIQPTYIESTNYNGISTGFRLNADGTLKLPGGSIDVDTLNVGSGGNLLSNSDLVNGTGDKLNTWTPSGWQISANVGLGSVSFRQGYSINPERFPEGVSGAQMYDPNNNPGVTMLEQSSFPVYAGRRYEVHADLGTIQCGAYIDIVWLDGANNIIGNVADGSISIAAAEGLGGGKTLTAFKRCGCYGIAPNGACIGVMRIIKLGPTPGLTNSYCFFGRPYAGRAGLYQTKFSEYSPAGVGTRITPEGISTPSLAALNAILGDCYAGSLRGGSFTGYAWPGAGGGFYLGPPGLLLGNPNVGGYVQIGENGDLYLPGMRVVGGTLYFTQASAINTNNLVVGSVTVGNQVGGTNVAQLNVGVPAGEVYQILCLATFRQTNSLSETIFPNAGDSVRQCSLTNAVGMIREFPTRFINGFGPQFQFGPATLLSSFQLGQPGGVITARAEYEVYGFNTPVDLTVLTFRR